MGRAISSAQRIERFFPWVKAAAAKRDGYTVERCPDRIRVRVLGLEPLAIVFPISLRHTATSPKGANLCVLAWDKDVREGQHIRTHLRTRWGTFCRAEETITDLLDTIDRIRNERLHGPPPPSIPLLNRLLRAAG